MGVVIIFQKHLSVLETMCKEPVDFFLTQTIHCLSQIPLAHKSLAVPRYTRCMKSHDRVWKGNPGIFPMVRGMDCQAVGRSRHLSK